MVVAHVEAGRECLDDGLWAVEVAVLAHHAPPASVVGPEAWDELGRLGGRDDPRRDAFLVLEGDVRAQPFECRVAVGGEEIAAALADERYARVEPFIDLVPEADRLRGEAAGDARSPLPADAPGLDA